MRTYLVTGSASGIGASTATVLRKAGARVIGVDRADAEVIADLSTDAGRDHVIGAVSDMTEGTLDGVVACAGITLRSPMIVRVNFFGVTKLLTRAQRMLAAGTRPRVVVVSSLASIHPVCDSVIEACLDDEEELAAEVAAQAIAAGREQTLYASTKTALSRWVRRSAGANEWAGAGIALNAICPGTVRTPMTAALLADPEARQAMDEIVPMPLGGYMSPETIAEACVWFAAAENTHITGQCVFVDGGADAILRSDSVW